MREVVENYLAGESWDATVPEEVEVDHLATVMMLSFFASRERAEQFVAENGPDGPSLEVLAAASAESMATAVVGYARLGRAIYEASLGMELGAPVRVERGPGRNDPCPCGSGRKFKRCCGASAPGVE